MDTLALNIENAIIWDGEIITKGGRTQQSEAYYIHVVGDQLTNLGAILPPPRGSQLPVDFKDVKFPDGTMYSFECKKVNKGTRFLFNDTVPNADVYYIFIYVHVEKVIVQKGSIILQTKRIPVSQNSLKEEFSHTVGEHVYQMLKNDEFTNESIKVFFKISMNFIALCVSRGVLSYFDFGQVFKNTYKFGNFWSRPRPNWTIDVPYL